ncbi:MAG: hypothetical protein AAGE98_09745 [Actinomycetota bacterium]
MRALRLLALIIIGGLVAVGVVLDERDRDLTEIDPPVLVSTADSRTGTWFCAGGSGAVGSAAVGLEIVNAGTDDAIAEVQLVLDTTDDGQRIEVDLAAGSRTPINLPQFAPDAAWLGAIVEIDDADVTVEQTFDGLSGTDRAPCATATASSLFSADGATRVLAEGETMTVLLMNPFQDDAIADIRFDADVGPDSLSAVVIPARRVVAIDVTEEVTVAARVHTSVTVTSGRLVANRLQVRNGAVLRGLAVTPFVQDGATVSVLPVLATDLGVFDRIHVTNPSDTTAEVDLEIVTDGSATLDPIELTVRAGRTVVVDVATESRLAALPAFSVVARSLTGTPVAVAVERAAVLDADVVPGTAAMPALDAAATAWLVALDGNVSDIAVVNPSSDAIATVQIQVDGQTVESFELGPGRRQTVDGTAFGARAIVRVDASAPVVVGRANEGFTSRQMLAGVVADGAVALDQLD